MKYTLRWIFRALFCEDNPREQDKKEVPGGTSEDIGRWERGFRSIVTRIHGARKEFDIPMVVDKVDAVFQENARLRAALSEALASLDLATSDCLLMALASKRALAKFKDSDDEPCRWCGSEEDIHEDHCPVHVLVDIGFVGLIGDEVMRRSMERFVEEEDLKRREARS